MPATSPTLGGVETLRPVHLSAVTEAIEQIGNGERIRLAFSVPPRHYKTTTLLHGVAWLMKRRPGIRVAYLTYGIDYAEAKSRELIGIVQRAGIELGDRKTFSEWNTSDGSVFVVAGLIGGIMGQGFDVVIVDDPYRSRQDAESATIRSRTLESFGGNISTRQGNNPTSFIVLHTRWHPDDLIGNLTRADFADSNPFTYINVPAIDDVGQALLPQYWDTERLAETRSTIGEYEWYSQFLGQPRPRGSEMFVDPQRYTHGTVDGVYSIGADLAYTAKKASDYSVAVVLCRPRNEPDKTYVVDVVRKQVAAPEFASTLRELATRYSASVRWYTGGGGEGGVGDFMRQAGVPIHAVAVSVDKFVRALPVSTAWNAGKVLVPHVDNGKTPHWLRDFLSEVRAFTGQRDPHDDQVDALAAAYDGLGSAAPVSVETWDRSGRRAVRSLRDHY